MVGTYRMKRVHGGLLAFAEVTVRHDSSLHSAITFAAEVTQYAPFRRALERGIQFAMSAHRAQGGIAYGVEVLSLIDLPADTMEDAVTCAAAGAAWKALGHLEKEVCLVLAAHGWQVEFSALKDEG